MSVAGFWGPICRAAQGGHIQAFVIREAVFGVHMSRVNTAPVNEIPEPRHPKTLSPTALNPRTLTP